MAKNYKLFDGRYYNLGILQKSNLSQSFELTTDICSNHNLEFEMGIFVSNPIQAPSIVLLTTCFCFIEVQIVRSLNAKTLNFASIKRLLQQQIKTTSIVVAVLDIPGKTTIKKKIQIVRESLPGLRPR